MAYLHCHTKGCDWSQDDFWDFKIDFRKYWVFGYNPLSIIIRNIIDYWIPRRIEFDYYWAKNNGFKSNKIFTWTLLFFELKRCIKTFLNMKWWTYKNWKKVRKKAICPKCRKHNFDID